MKDEERNISERRAGGIVVSLTLAFAVAVLAMTFWLRRNAGDPPPRGYHWGSCLIKD
jgi:hypothetical protein